jgi:phosphatidylglycerol:prolipoprotein diacylglycerol transferase
MLPYPHINPVIINIGPIAIHWYGLMYLLTFAIGYFLLGKFIKERNIKADKDFIADFMLTMLLGVVLGGRIGYILFFNFEFYLSHLSEILSIWKGGMSFYGGALGVIIALSIFAKVKKMSLYEIADIVIPIIPIGIFLVRIGNFINAELYGRVTESQFCMIFPSDPTHCRYPSQLIEAFLEGLIVLLIIYPLRKKIKKPGVLSWLFLASYGFFRFFAEFFREPDAHIGFVWTYFTRNQIFSIITVVVALTGIWWRYHADRTADLRAAKLRS